MSDGVAVFIDIVHNYRNGSMESHAAFIVSNLSLFGTIELKAFTLIALAELGDVVKTEYHVLRRHCDRSTVGGVEDVVGTEH